MTTRESRASQVDAPVSSEWGSRVDLMSKEMDSGVCCVSSKKYKSAVQSLSRVTCQGVSTQQAHRDQRPRGCKFAKSKEQSNKEGPRGAGLG